MDVTWFRLGFFEAEAETRAQVQEVVTEYSPRKGVRAAGWNEGELSKASGSLES